MRRLRRFLRAPALAAALLVASLTLLPGCDDDSNDEDGNMVLPGTCMGGLNDGDPCDMAADCPDDPGPPVDPGTCVIP